MYSEDHELESDSVGFSDETRLLKTDGRTTEIPLRELIPTTSLQRKPVFEISTTPANECDPSYNAAAEALLGQPGADFGLSSTRETRNQKTRWGKCEAWQKVVLFSCILLILALICNIIILIWALTQPLGSFDTARLLYQGDCGRASSIDFWSHMAINVLSTIILAGGNYASQILSAPTRDAIDKAHEQGRFNSMVFSTISSVIGPEVLLAKDFLTIHPRYNVTLSQWSNQTWENSDWEYQKWRDVLNENLTDFDNLTIPECHNTFSAKYIHDYKASLWFTNISTSLFNSSVLTPSYDGVINPSASPPWTVPYLYANGTSIEIELLYCLGLKTNPSCTVELVPALLCVIIACNLIKVIVLYNVFYIPHAPLNTIGDAISSFMTFPDPSTKDFSIVSSEEVFGSSQRGSFARTYFLGASKIRWISTILLSTLWIVGITLFLITERGSVSMSQQWQDGFEALEFNSSRPMSLDLISSIILVNLPQVYLSFIYVFYNALITKLLLSRELVTYSRERKGLRTTNPVGDQRSTYFLSLPFRFSIPLAGLFAMLHWMISQSLYLAQINYYYLGDNTSVPQHQQGDGEYAFAWSRLGMAMSLIVGGILIVGAVLLGFFKFKTRMPLAHSDSRAISMACHPSDENEDSSKKLQYGIIADLGNGRYHVGFSSGPVMPVSD